MSEHKSPDRPRVSAKATAMTVGAALATIVVWLIGTLGGVDLPTAVEAAVSTLVVAGVTFAASYLPRDERR